MANFISHDGKDSQGNRAEVNVQTGVAVVQAIEEKEGKGTARVTIKQENLQYPQHGWIKTEDPLLAVLRKALDTKENIEYRIESQRKKHVDRAAKMGELRKSAADANENTVSIFAGVNGALTIEAVTDPAEDPAPAGRIRATDQRNNNVAPADNAASENNPQPSNRFVVEERSFKEYNSDGLLNFGSYAVQAAVGAELYVRQKLIAAGEQDIKDSKIVYFASLILAISDKLQATFTGKNVDRMANSHTRMRASVYATVDRVGLPSSLPEVAAWVTLVGRESWQQIKNALAILESGDLDSLVAQASNKAPATTPTKSAEPPAEQTESPAEPATPASSEAPAEDLLKEMASSSSLALFPVQKTLPAGEKASDETIDVFREFVEENEFDLVKTGGLLRYTFGVGQAAELPEELLGQFIDFYIGEGEANFRNVLDYVAGLAEG